MLARKDRCWTLNCKSLVHYVVCRKLHPFHANGFNSYKNEKSIGGLNGFCTSVWRDAFHHKQLKPSSLSAIKAEITLSASRQHRCACALRMASQSDQEYLPKLRRATTCASGVHSAFSPITTKWQCRFCCLAQVNVDSIFFRETYYFKWLDLSKAVWSMVCHWPSRFFVNFAIRQFGWMEVSYVQ